MNIDTVSIARDLKATELPVEQAEAIAAAIGRATSENVATKADLLVLEERLTARIEAASRQTLVWLAGAIFATAGALMAAIKL